MLDVVLTSVIVSTVVWGLIWNFSRLAKKTRFAYLVNEKLSERENPIGNVYTRPPVSYEMCQDGDYVCTDGVCTKGGCIQSNFSNKDEFAELLKQVEETNGSKIIFINHRSSSSGFTELTRLFGESYTTLSQKDAIKIIDILRDIPEDKTLDIILNTTGGSATAAEIIINALCDHKGHIRFYIPHYAQSAGMLLALAGDDIYLGKNGFVSPFDPQLGYGISAASVKRFCDNRSSRHGCSPDSTGWVGDLLYLIYGEAQASIDRINTLIDDVLDSRDRGDDVAIVREELASGKYNHCKPLFFSDLNSILNNVHSEVPENIFRLFELHNKSEL
jgi:hypothetical protein